MIPEEIPADVYGPARRAFIKAFDATGNYASLVDIDTALRPALATAITTLLGTPDVPSPAPDVPSPCCVRHHPGDLDARLHTERLRGHAEGVKEGTARAEAAWTAWREHLERHVRAEVVQELDWARSWHAQDVTWVDGLGEAAKLVKGGLERYAAWNGLSYPPPAMADAQAYQKRAEKLAQQTILWPAADIQPGLPGMEERQ